MLIIAPGGNNRDLFDSCIPRTWKIANVSPVPKNNDLSFPSNLLAK